MATNGWTLGTMYYAAGGFGLPGGVGRGFTQPGGPFTLVYPLQVVDPSSTIAPFSTNPVTEQTGVMSFACGHFADEPMIIRDFDYTTNMSVALVCCPRCSCITSTIEPFEAAYNITINPVVLP